MIGSRLVFVVLLTVALVGAPTSGLPSADQPPKVVVFSHGLGELARARDDVDRAVFRFLNIHADGERFDPADIERMRVQVSDALSSIEPFFSSLPRVRPGYQRGTLRLGLDAGLGGSLRALFGFDSRAQHEEASTGRVLSAPLAGEASERLAAAFAQSGVFELRLIGGENAARALLEPTADLLAAIRTLGNVSGIESVQLVAINGLTTTISGGGVWEAGDLDVRFDGGRTYISVTDGYWVGDSLPVRRFFIHASSGLRELTLAEACRDGNFDPPQIDRAHWYFFAFNWLTERLAGPGPHPVHLYYRDWGRACSEAHGEASR